MPPVGPTQDWRSPQELERPLPRPVRLRADGIGLCVFSVLLILAGVAEVGKDLRRDPLHQASFWWVPFLFLGFFIAGGVWLVSSLWRQGHLLAVGLPASAVVTRCVVGRTRNGTSCYQLGYEFPLPNGGLYRGNGNRWQPHEEGSVITILYDPDKPHRNSLYPVDMVKLAGD